MEAATWQLVGCPGVTGCGWHLFVTMMLCSILLRIGTCEGRALSLYISEAPATLRPVGLGCQISAS